MGGGGIYWRDSALSDRDFHTAGAYWDLPWIPLHKALIYLFDWFTFVIKVTMISCHISAWTIILIVVSTSYYFALIRCIPWLSSTMFWWWFAHLPIIPEWFDYCYPWSYQNVLFWALSPVLLIFPHHAMVSSDHCTGAVTCTRSLIAQVYYTHQMPNTEIHRQPFHVISTRNVLFSRIRWESYATWASTISRDGCTLPRSLLTSFGDPIFRLPLD